MVLKKSEWYKKKKLDFTGYIKLVSEFVDKRLINNTMSIATKDVTAFVPYESREEFLVLFIKAYEEAGWIVKRDRYSDCRESWDTLKFS